MPEYLAPGVYIEEFEIGAKPIEGVSTSTAGMVGVTQKGPLNEPTLITSFAEFGRIFGGYLDSSYDGHRYLPHAVEGFFNNGGQRVYVTRVAVTEGDDAAAKSNVKLPDNRILSTTLSADATAGDTTLEVVSVDDIEVGDIIRINDGAISEFVEVTDISGVTITITPSIQYPHSAGTTIEKMAPTISVEAVNEGVWGNDINIKTYDSTILKAKVKTSASAGDAFIELNTTSGIEAKTVLEFAGTGNYGVVSSVSGSRVFLEEVLPVALAIDDVVTTCEFKLVATYGSQEEVFEKLSMDENHSRFFETIINDSSQLISVAKLSSTTPPPDNRPLLLEKDDAGWNLAGGQDGVSGITDETIIGVDSEEPAERTGLYTLKNIDPISIVAVPNGTSQDIQNAMIIHCELMKDRFAVLDPVKNHDLTEIQEQRSLYDSKYAALYYPWINVNDPYSEAVLTVPPSGHICGIYARSDTERGVHKAPANEVVRGALSLERRIVKGQQDILNPLGVNCLRVFEGRGLRVWGARTISSDTLWKYVNVRRLFIFLEESIDEGTQWVVFEPNDQKLWARVRATITEFLTRVWKDGALFGSTPEEAFFVKCDETTMTQDDINNGRLICVIGVAPVRPAEFVIFRIAQLTASATQ